MGWSTVVPQFLDFPTMPGKAPVEIALFGDVSQNLACKAASHARLRGVVSYDQATMEFSWKYHYGDLLPAR